MKSEHLQDSIPRIGWALRRVVSLVYQDSSAMRKRCGITGPQSLALKCLHRAADPLSSAALSRALGVTPANVTGIVDRLADKDLVERIQRDGDRRKIYLRLTEAGVEMAGSLPGPMEDMLTARLGALPPRETTRIVQALETLVASLSDREAPVASGAAASPGRKS